MNASKDVVFIEEIAADMSEEHSVMKIVVVMLERGDVVMHRAVQFHNLHTDGAWPVRAESAVIESTGGRETAPSNGESLRAQLDQRSQPVPAVFPVAESSGSLPAPELWMLRKS
eukprot:IDg3159t1